LYEASFLLRDYGFDLEELPFDPDGILPLDQDPKRVYADRTLRHAPVELNRADREMLMRVPGIGPRKADNLLSLRRKGRLGDISLLRKRGLISERSAPYVTVDGHRPGFQRALFPTGTKFHTA
jgi:predicted DNA-binding helix-hairpin-helix protein